MLPSVSKFAILIVKTVKSLELLQVLHISSYVTLLNPTGYVMHEQI
jgi:hypothetical protein